MSAGRGQLTVEAEGHVVRFYGGDQDLAEGIEAGDMAVVAATRPHRLAFEAELRAPGAAAEDTHSFPGILEAARAARHFVTGVLRPRRDQALTQDAAILPGGKVVWAELPASPKQAR
jgi:hypothetical protein